MNLLSTIYNFFLKKNCSESIMIKAWKRKDWVSITRFPAATGVLHLGFLSKGVKNQKECSLYFTLNLRL